MSHNVHGRLKPVVLIKGAGEMATGVAHSLFRSGLLVCMTEIAKPLAVRRGVCFSEAIYDGEKTVEGIKAVRAREKVDIYAAWDDNSIPILIDPQCRILEELKPDVLIDAIMAKKNSGTQIGDAGLVIGLGPGFRAGGDVHFAVETNRGPRLGRIIERGGTEPDTGVPADVEGYTQERVLRATATGKFVGRKNMGDRVQKGDIVAELGGVPVRAEIAGVLRGILRDRDIVEMGVKVGDVDPRGNVQDCFAISDKARAIGEGVLKAILRKYPL